MTREERVAEFRIAGDLETNSVDPAGMILVWNCLTEEMIELSDAGKAYHEKPSEETRAAFIKEWADVQYVLSQLAVFYEFDGQRAFDIVADNNMTKVIDGKVIRREDGKILKPEGYQYPDLRGL